MVSVAEASSIVFDHLFEPAVETVGFADAVNKVLAETSRCRPGLSSLRPCLHGWNCNRI